MTGLAAALRFAPEAFLQKWSLDGFDKGVLLAVLAIYAVMGAISFYERGTDKTTAYFRHLGIILAIRDLWTKVQFEFPGHSRRFWHVRCTSAYHPLATEERTS